jgi:5,10-methylenetetrahydrofolate reductase
MQPACCQAGRASLRCLRPGAHPGGGAGVRAGQGGCTVGETAAGVVHRPSLQRRLEAPGLLLTAEVDPPRAPDLLPLLERAGRFAPWVDAVNVTDGSLARVRLAGLFAAAALRERLGLEVIAHVTARDRNRIALQADLLGAAAFGLRAVLVLSGDPPDRGDEPEARAAGDLDTPALIRLVGSLNGGRTASGRDLDGHTELLVGCAANPGAADVPREVDKLAQRVAAGARFCQTQPVFDVEAALRFVEAARPLGIPLLCGLLPLRDVERARYFSGIPGMAVPPSVVERLAAGGPETGVEIACETAQALAPHVRGVHLFPMGSARVVRAVAEAVRPWRQGTP